MSWLRQGSNVSLLIGPFLDDSDGKTPETGLTITQADIRISKAGFAFDAQHGTSGGVHNEAGWYWILLDTTDTDTLGDLIIHVAIPGALPVWVTHQVKPPAIYDAFVSGLGKLPVDITQYMGDDCPAADMAGYPVVTLKQDVLVPISLVQAVAGTQIAGTVGDALHRLLTLLDAAISSRSSHTAGDAADAVWDEARADHALPGSFGETASAGSEADWSSDERAQIRQALGVDGDKATTAAGDINTLLARTAGAASITVSAPVLSTGRITLVCSDDYQPAESRQVTFRDADHGLDLSGATVALLLVERLGNKQTGTPITVAGTITADGDDAIYAFTLTAAQTAALKVGVNRYFYSVGLTLGNGHVLTRAQGLVTTTAQSGATS